jgi:hypothetical protein
MKVAGKAAGAVPVRLAEATAEAALILALVLGPTGWRAMDAELAVVLAVMLLVLTAGAYALHAVTFDYFRLTHRRDRVDVPVEGGDRLNPTGATGRMPG